MSNNKSMRISELIEYLEKYKESYGNIPVKFTDDKGKSNDIVSVEFDADKTDSIIEEENGCVLQGYNIFVSLRSTPRFITI